MLFSLRIQELLRDPRSMDEARKIGSLSNNPHSKFRASISAGRLARK